MLAWWRVRQWSFNFDITLIDFSSNQEQLLLRGETRTDDRGEIVENTVPDIVDERGLVCVSSATTSFTQFADTPVGNYLLDLVMLSSLRPIKTDGQNLFFSADFTMSVPIPGGSIGMSPSGSFVATAGSFVYQAGELEITRPIYFVRNREIEFVPTINVLVKPARYWPYDPGDGGGPIYDTVTGRLLRGFPN